MLSSLGNLILTNIKKSIMYNKKYEEYEKYSKYHLSIFYNVMLTFG